MSEKLDAAAAALVAKIAEGAAARRAVALAAALCADVGHRAAARQLRAILDELGTQPGVTL